MNEKTQVSNRWFYKLYIIYGVMFLILSGVMIGACYNDFYIRIIIPTALFFMCLLIFFFVMAIKRGVLSLFRACSTSLDEAIDGKTLRTINEETELALFQAKLARFVAMRDKSFRDAKAQKEQIETLLADISHQTKTPIANILLYSQLLAERSMENTDLISKLTNQSEKLKSLIQTLVEMSRLENGIIHCVPKRENLKEFLIQVIGDHYDNAQGKNMEILLECPAELTAVFDWKWLREAVGNILDNAIKYTPQGGNIEIKAIAYELFVQITVKDTGMGIREEELPRIFGRFYRSHENAGSEGLGLGLYLAREMVVAQRGYIKVLSEPEKGSDFHIFVPATF